MPTPHVPRMRKHHVRIVGGTFRRTRIPVPAVAQLRPTPDRVRETLFNWLAHRWQGSLAGRRVLDLFAGSGALGFEAASRGAEEVWLVESSGPALAHLRAMQTRLQAPAIHIHAGDAMAFLQALPRARFDLLLLDPPFAAGWLERLLPWVDRAVLPGGLIYLESEASLTAPPAPYHALRQARAGHVHYALWEFAAPQKSGNNDSLTPHSVIPHSSEAE